MFLLKSHIFVPDIWTKVVSVNQHVDTNSLKLKVNEKLLGWAWS